MQALKFLSIVMIIHDIEVQRGAVPFYHSNFPPLLAQLEINPTPIKPKQTSNLCQNLPERMIYQLPAEHWCK